MTLFAAIRKAKLTGASQIYRLSMPWYRRGIDTPFDVDDPTATDWQVYYPETFAGYSGTE